MLQGVFYYSTGGIPIHHSAGEGVYRISWHFTDETTIHNCLGLRSVATVAGAWDPHPWYPTSPVQGKKEKILDHFSFVYPCIARSNCKSIEEQLSTMATVTYQTLETILINAYVCVKLISYITHLVLYIVTYCMNVLNM